MNDKSKQKPSNGRPQRPSGPITESHKDKRPTDFGDIRDGIVISNTFAPPDPLPTKGDKNGGSTR
ncbi:MULTISPECIES: hypothetical protein [Klebsiella]|uniref:hypothetical protein n=1 Tax=Klebsiella TaxID=570 RepID=UPI0015A8C9E5|nr:MULTISPECIES: hypothetical protein [Klebsiella]DAK70614.1 MAG TPA: hypothetical protein [Caudoviricetes sp.]HBY9615574.1 hypothetical protein [Klebsiella pneumoniae]MDV1906286.1 hypothetical protein [Klebsiella pasteurii]MDV1912101.1 hypothetical protein [Klebsiella pasteurii]HBM2937044.1 hypothetical protein [Klebsiella michiganensis]